MMRRIIAAGILLGLVSATSALAQKPATPGRPSPQIFSLDLSDRASNWTPGTPDTRIGVRNRVMELQGGKSQFGYQLVGARTKVEPGKVYDVRFDVQVTSGSMSIFVLDANADKVVAIQPITQRRGTVTFTAPSDLVQIIVNNNNSSDDQASSARIARIEMVKKN